MFTVIFIAALLFLILNLGVLLEIVCWLVTAALKFGLVLSGLAALAWVHWLVF